ncbi:MAG: hypothetical protein Q9223_000628 [Gallowayella weberi]
MPPVRSTRNRKPPPDGFEDIEDTLLEFGNKMKDAENASHEGKKRHEVLWPIFQINHQRSRYIYELYYVKEAISKHLYEWLLKNGYGDANLIAKWKKQGYEKLCCLRCVQTKETNFNSTCICRVPKVQLKEDQTIECVSCGCRGSRKNGTQFLFMISHSVGAVAVCCLKTMGLEGVPKHFWYYQLSRRTEYGLFKARKEERL